MGALTTIFALMTLFTVAYGDVELELSISDVLTTFSTIDRILRAIQEPDMDTDGGGNSPAENLLTKVKWYLYGYFSKLIDMYEIRRNLRPRVEMGHGTYKTPVINYPEGHSANRMKFILNLKKKREQQGIPEYK
ncbi:uncharacterized protein LOC118271622 [Spodoptera frugiperda]|uniref:Uncharacterized protein LOC118271622 n=1 Tax=Spodoptera frugiperda TaxID=7108 RepID=A0A9R0D7V0_SPOFR|nr:uncharacterized protein LOC118271622 [Spodoptera frugiperda]